MKYLLENQTTERLYFRLLNRSDYNTWLELFITEGVAGFLGMGDIKSPEEQCNYWFDRCEERYLKGLGGMNVVIDKKTNEFIGQTGLLIQEVDGIEELEVAYSMLPQHWGKGYATEAARKCRDFAFENNYSETLISIVHVDNIKSEKVAKNNGMLLSKTTVFKNMPVNIFRISKTEWLKSTNSTI